MSRAPPLIPSSSGSHSYSSPKLGPAAIYSTHSPTGSPRPIFAQQLPGTLSPYRDASARYAHLGSPRISSLSRDATAALKASNYPTSSSRPTSPTPGSRSPSPSSDSGDSSGSSSRGSRGPADNDDHDNSQPLLTRSDSSSRIGGPSRHADDDRDERGASTSAGGPGANTDSPSGLKRVDQLQPIDTKSEYFPPPLHVLVGRRHGFLFVSPSFDSQQPIIGTSDTWTQHTILPFSKEAQHCFLALPFELLFLECRLIKSQRAWPGSSQPYSGSS